MSITFSPYPLSSIPLAPILSITEPEAQNLFNLAEQIAKLDKNRLDFLNNCVQFHRDRIINQLLLNNTHIAPSFNIINIISPTSSSESSNDKTNKERADSPVESKKRKHNSTKPSHHEHSFNETLPEDRQQLREILIELHDDRNKDIQAAINKIHKKHKIKKFTRQFISVYRKTLYLASNGQFSEATKVSRHMTSEFIKEHFNDLIQNPQWTSKLFYRHQKKPALSPKNQTDLHAPVLTESPEQSKNLEQSSEVVYDPSIDLSSVDDPIFSSWLKDIVDVE